MTPIGSRLRRAAWLALFAHLVAGLAMLLVLRLGLETNADLADRLRFVGQKRLLWSLGWLSWTAAAATILNFYSVFALAHRRLGAARVALRSAVLLTVAAVAADWTAQGLEVFLLPGLAAAGNLPGFLGVHRSAVLLTGCMANGLYTTAAALLLWASRRAYPPWVALAGLGVVVGGVALSAGAWGDSAVTMLVANLVLVPSLLGWLAGVATTPLAE
jgi:hypothetical protein